MPPKNTRKCCQIIIYANYNWLKIWLKINGLIKRYYHNCTVSLKIIIKDNIIIRIILQCGLKDHDNGVCIEKRIAKVYKTHKSEHFTSSWSEGNKYIQIKIHNKTVY